MGGRTGVLPFFSRNSEQVLVLGPRRAPTRKEQQDDARAGRWRLHFSIGYWPKLIMAYIFYVLLSNHSCIGKRACMRFSLSHDESSARPVLILTANDQLF